MDKNAYISLVCFSLHLSAIQTRRGRLIAMLNQNSDFYSWWGKDTFFIHDEPTPSDKSLVWVRVLDG